MNHSLSTLESGIEGNVKTDEIARKVHHLHSLAQNPHVESHARLYIRLKKKEDAKKKALE